LAQAAKNVITILGTKALERIGTRIPDILTEKIRKFTASLEQISPNTANALKLAPEGELGRDRVEREIIAAAALIAIFSLARSGLQYHQSNRFRSTTRGL